MEDALVYMQIKNQTNKSTHNNQSNKFLNNGINKSKKLGHEIKTRELENRNINKVGRSKRVNLKGIGVYIYVYIERDVSREPS